MKLDITKLLQAYVDIIDINGEVIIPDELLSNSLIVSLKNVMLTGDITLDEEELSVAEWFEREEIPVHQKTVSLTNEMILNFKAGNWKY